MLAGGRIHDYLPIGTKIHKAVYTWVMRAKKRHKAGRPRSFDTEKALDRALEVFRAKGYEGASLSDLTRAMGINRPSLYAAFGDKEALFRKVLKRYRNWADSFFGKALTAPTAREVAEGLLYAAADMQTTGAVRGCLITQGALVCGDEATPVRRELAVLRRANEAAIRGRLQRAKKQGDLPADSSPVDLARYLTTVMQGMSVLANGGASRAELRRVADTALLAFPR